MKSIIGSRSEKGQAFPEYAMLLAFISLVVVIGLALFGQKISSVYCKITNELNGKTVPVTGAPANHVGSDRGPQRRR